MSITQRILLHVGLGSALVVAVVTAVTYRLVYEALQARDLKQLEIYVDERTRREELGFRTIYSNLEVVRGQFLKRDKEPVPADFQARWDERFMLYPDGAWRSREEFFSPRVYSNLWMRKGAPLNPQIMTRILRAQEICEDVEPGWVDSFISLYFILPSPATMGFDPRIARWSWQTPGDYDFDADEWVQESRPARNPSRGFTWTGVFVDAPSGKPFVTVQLPVDKDGEQIATVAHDMHLDLFFKEMARSDFEGASHVIFRPDGRLIVHQGLREKIMASNGALSAQTAGDPALASLYRLAVAQQARKFSGFEPVSQSYFSAARLPGAEWYFVTLMPRATVQAQAGHSARWVLWSGLVSLGLVLFSIACILRNQIARPLRALTGAARAMSAGAPPQPLFELRQDELGELAGSFNDLSAQVAARESELRQLNRDLEQRIAERTAELARFASILDLSPDFVGICDMQLNVVYLNRTGRQIAKLAPGASFEGLHVSRFHREEPFQALAATMPIMIRDGIWTGETELLDSTGRTIPVSAACIMLRDANGQPEYTATIMRDLSERQRVQQELERALRRERELGEMKTSFVSMVSHEFRTPLGVIMSATEVLSRYFERLAPEKRARHLEMIFRSTKNLALLIEEVLLLGRVEEGRMKFTPVPMELEKFCRSLCDEMFSATGGTCQIRVKLQGDLAGAVTDESLLRHILSNLLSNACKYSDPGQSVEFECGREGASAVFVIRDRGIGIPEKDQAQLFTSFTRASNVGTRPGTGLGLVVVQRCVELHGGKLSLRSAVGEGTTATVVLPVFSPALP